MTARAGARPRVRIGVLGGRSWIAGRAVLPAIAASRNADVGPLGSRTGPVSYDDVLADPGVDAVYVPLPNGMHRQWVERAAAAGKHVLCEKPLGCSRQETEAMAAVCRDAGVLLAEAYMTPFHPRTAEVVARLGELGEIRHVDSAFTFPMARQLPPEEPNYRWLPEQGGGALLDVGVYCLTPVLQALGGRPDRVTAHQVLADTGIDLTTSARLEWDGDAGVRATASVLSSVELPERQHLHIAGTEAALTLDRPFTPGPADVHYAVTRRDGRVEQCTTEGADCYQRMVEAFADAVQGTAPWPVPFDRVSAVADLCDRIVEAAGSSPA